MDSEEEDPGTMVLGDIEVHYRRAGEGRAVVLVHGLAQDHAMWRRQQDALTGCTTFAYDVRGHGRTTVGAADGTLAQLGGDLIALLERTGPATCVGFSLGGTIALWAAAERPDLVTDVVAIATSSVVGRRAGDFFAERIELFSSSDHEAIAETLLADTRLQTVDPDGAAAVVADRLAAIGDRRGYVNAARAMARLVDEPLNARLETLRCPVLVVGAAEDVFVTRKAADIMLEHLADGRFAEVPDAGHLVTDDNPDAVTRILQEWLSGAAERARVGA
jgi:3-oxoadipate enol-lactonase